MGEIIDFEKYITDKKNKEKEKLDKERMQIYTDFLAIIEKLKGLKDKKEMNKILAEIAKASLRKLPPQDAVEVIKHYEKILSHYFPDIK